MQIKIIQQKTTAQYIKKLLQLQICSTFTECLFYHRTEAPEQK